MIDQDKLDKIEHRANNAALGYNTGDLARHYANDVKLLVKERDELLGVLEQLPGGRNILRRGGALYLSITEAEVEDAKLLDASNCGIGSAQTNLVDECARLCEQLQEVSNRLATTTECSDLWKRDCEAAQARVRELEQERQVTSSAVRGIAPYVSDEVNLAATFANDAKAGD